jgi:hypothetical protein
MWAVAHASQAHAQSGAAGQGGKAKAAGGPAPAGRGGQRPNFDARTGLAEPGLSALIAASSKGDRNEVIRQAERIGVARVQSILSAVSITAGGDKDKETKADRADRAQVMAALDAARVMDGGVRLLAPVARLLLDDDSRVAERAARAVGELLRADRLDKLIEWEIAAEDVYGACAALARTARNDSAATSLRIAAIEALGEAHAYCRGDLKLGTVTTDTGPDVRRAALLAPQITQGESVDSIGGLIEDPVPLVAGAAATVWCRHQYDFLRKGGVNGETEKRRLFKIRMLLMADVAPPEDASEILPCLALSKDPEDLKAVEMVRQRLKQAPMQRW